MYSEPILNRERYNQIFMDVPEVEEEKAPQLKCSFCGSTYSLFGLPNGMVACDGCLTDLEGETEWEGR